MTARTSKNSTKASSKRNAKPKDTVHANGSTTKQQEANAPVIVEETDSLGRPSKYKPEFAPIAAKMCELGATDAELAAAFEVDTTTIWRWQSAFPAFCNALIAGKTAADNRVARSLYQRAVGYTFDSEKVFNHQGTVVRAKTVEHVPPDPGAAKLWLCNRLPDEWRDTAKVEVTGKNGEALQIDATAAVKALLEAMPDLGVLQLNGTATAAITSDGEGRS
jgi:hypothetical protein